MKNKNIYIYIIIIGTILTILTWWGWSNLIKEEYVNGITIYYIDTREYINNINTIHENILDNFIEIITIPNLTFTADILQNIKNIINILLLIVNTMFIYPIRTCFELVNAIFTLVGLNPDNQFMQFLQTMSNIKISYWN